MPSDPIPLLLGALLFGVGVGLRSWLQRRRHGSTGIVLFRERGVGRWRDLGVIVGPLLMLGQALAAWLRPAWLAPIALPLRVPSGARAAAIGLALLSIAAMAFAQLQMGASWRIGIDEQARPGLVTSGSYRFSRNPIYACMLGALTAFAILPPTWLSCALLISVALGTRWQVAREEAYLVRVYGAEYRAYAARVGRFLPGLGRIRA